MPTNVAQFNKALEVAAKKLIDEEVLDLIKAVCLETFRRIVDRTPIDTGRARGNWQVEINKQAATTIIDPNLWDEVFERGAKIIETMPPFSVVHITNNVEYVYYLEYVRRSQQHPEGMVEITLQEMTVWLRSA
jgi:hypothetical protein